MKRLLTLLLTVFMITSSLSFVSLAEQGSETDGFIAINADPVTIPNTEDGSWNGSEIKLFDSDTAPIDLSDGATAVTFIFKATGINTPVDLSGFHVAFTCDKTIDYYAYNNNWGSSNKGLDGEGTEHPMRLYIPRDGYYAVTYNSKVLAMGSFDKKILTISSVGVMDPKSYAGKNYETINANSNATLQLVGVVGDNLAPAVSFYGINGEELAKDVTAEYLKVSNQDANSAKKYTLKTPTAILSETEGVTVPSKPATDKVRYQLIWKDKDGNVVDAVYKSGALYADFIEIDNTMSNVSFLDADGGIYKTVEATKGKILPESINDPEKASDADNNYFFKGWSLDGETVVEINEFVPEENEYTFKPIFVSDTILKGNIILDDIPYRGSVEAKIKLNKTKLTVDPIVGTKEAITGGELVISYNSALAESPDAIVPGKIVVPFTEINDDCTVNATVTFRSIEGAAGTLVVSVHEGFATSKSITSAAITGTSSSVQITGQQAGAYFNNSESVAINKNDGDKAPAQQTIWQGNVDFGEKKRGVTFVIKLEGIDTPIDISYMNFYFDATSFHSSNWFWNQAWGGAEEAFRYQSFPEDGCYYVYYDQRINNGRSIQKVTKLNFFEGSDERKGNTNANATVELKAVVAGNLQPIVTFHDTDGAVLTTVQKKYTDASGTVQDGKIAKQTGKIVSVDDIFASAEGIALPVKESDDPKISYEFDYWVDADGDPIDLVYMYMDAYPHFKVTDNRTAYDVIFKNYDGSELYKYTVREGDLPVYPDTLPLPKKPSSNTNSYSFKGWSPAITNAPVDTTGNSKGEDIVYTAQFEETERKYDVIFYNEDGTTVYAESLGLDFGAPAILPEEPTKDSTDVYTYTFAKWVDLDGKDVDLSSVKSDMSVKPYFDAKALTYTVTFIDSDKSTVLGKVTVNKGDPATITAPTKAQDAYYSYIFKEWVDENGNSVSLDSISTDMTVYASYSAAYVHPFKGDDFDAFADWMKPAIEYVVANGIMNGMGDSFAPNENMNRAMIVTVLWRYEGEPEAKEGYENKFTDLKANWYIPAVEWAASYGVVYGRNENSFDPDGNVTREEFAAILYRFSDEIRDEYMSYGRSTLMFFSDAEKISSWAETAVKWAYATGEVLNGPNHHYYDKTRYVSGKGYDSTGKAIFDPKGKASRAEVATMLYRYMTGAKLLKSELDIFGSEIINTYPSVYAVEDEYQIFALVEKDCTMWVEIDGVNYYDHSNGILRSDTFLHKVTVPMEALNKAKKYTVHLREMIERKPYYSVTGEVESYTFNFKPIEEKEEYNIINLADSHSAVDAPIGSGSYFGEELDLLIMNGDIIDNSDNINSFKILYKISGGITMGQVPCIYARGNHELRGIYAEHLADYTPTDNGKSYYTVNLGPIWCIVLDSGEDKDDSHKEYGNTVACNAFRAEQEKFLTDAMSGHEYDDASIRLIISHDPFACGGGAEPARMKKWCAMLKEMDAHLWLTGHYHSQFLEIPGGTHDKHGYPCALLTSSYVNGSIAHNSGAVTITKDQVTVKYVTESHVVEKQESVPVL